MPTRLQDVLFLITESTKSEECLDVAMVLFSINEFPKPVYSPNHVAYIAHLTHQFFWRLKILMESSKVMLLGVIMSL